MQAVKKYTNEDNKAFFRLEEIDNPSTPGDDEVQIQIQCIGICTSDVHVLHGAMQMPDGNTVGHEFSGNVVALGKNCQSDFMIGQKVICELAVNSCFNCSQCDAGHYEFCPYKKPPGWASQGVYTEYINMPKHCVMSIDNSVSLEVAALAEPVAICTYGVIERGQIDKNDFTVIYGMGPIGLLTLIMLQDLGMQNIVCVTPTHRGTQRFDLAKELGCEQVYSSDEDIVEIITSMTDGFMADCVIDCSGAESAINQGIDLLKKGGKLMALGIASSEDFNFHFNKALLKALHVVFSCTSSHNAWELSRGILERQQEKIKRLITHQFPLQDWESAYEKIESREAIKAVLHNK